MAKKEGVLNVWRNEQGRIKADLKAQPDTSNPGIIVPYSLLGKHPDPYSLNGRQCVVDYNEQNIAISLSFPAESQINLSSNSSREQNRPNLTQPSSSRSSTPVNKPPEFFFHREEPIYNKPKMWLKGAELHNEIENFRYRFEIAPWYGSVNGKENSFFTYRRSFKDSTKTEYDRRFIMDEVRFDYRTDKLLKNLHNRFQQRLTSLYAVHRIGVFSPARGVITGYGEPSVYNAGIRLHHTYGFPYIPAEGIQGMIRTLLIEQFFSKNVENALNDDGFRLIFGSENGRGIIDFVDAFPTALSKNSIQPEILTNHFPQYYTSDQLPTDKQSPIPVGYLAVVGTSFHVAFGSCKQAAIQPVATGLFAGYSPIAVVSHYLPLAFRFAGVGARTKNGWGMGELEFFKSNE